MVNNVRVAVRVRPFNQREIDRNAKMCIQMGNDKKKTTITNPEDGRVREFTFDYSYWSHDANDEHFVDQEEVFNNLGVDCLESAWEGYNCSLFAYGQTGSGKSFSMVGNAASDEVLHGSQAGIVPRVCRSMFDRIAAMDDPSVTFKVETSMLEIYNEQVRDLFNPTNAPAGGLKVREHPTTGPFVDGLSSLLVENNAAIEQLMEQGTKARTIKSTKMNQTSSRAHTIFQIILTQTRVDKDAGKATDRVSRINLVDLAGSERAKSTGASGDRLKEGININLSLSSLGNCIKMLAEKAKQGEGGSKRSKIHIPYRDSILTLLLKDSLGGNARTVMIAALSPADINFDETLSTLQYADRAKSIQNVAVVNEDQNEKMVRELREEVAALRKQLEGQAPQKVDEEAEAARKKLEEELAESQRLMTQLQMTWAEKQKATEAIEQERNKALEAMGVVVDISMQGQPQLVNLNEDASLSGCLVYFLREGDTVVGKAKVGDQPKPGEIQLQGLGIATEHCRLSHTPPGEDGSPIVTLHPNGGVATKTFVNGKQAPSTGVQLRHGDRVIFGSSNFFKYTDPAEAKRIRKEREAALEARTDDSNIEPATMDVVDWEFAQHERLQEAMASSLEDSNAAKAALQKAQQDFAEQEAKLAAEKAEAEARLVEQQNAFDAQIAEQAGNANATVAALEETKAQLEAQRVAFQQELVAKEAVLDAKRQELHREQVRERQQALLEDKLHQLIPLVEESNLLSAELRREVLFEVKVVSDYVQQTAAAAAAGERPEPRSITKVKVTYLKQDRSCLWEQDKFSNRIYLMRELYARFVDDPSCLAEVTSDVDPFYDPPESQLIGVAHILLEPLAYQLDIQQKTPVVDYQGNTVGSLAVELVPCTPDGATEGVDLVDSPDELVGRRMDLLVRVKSASGKLHYWLSRIQNRMSRLLRMYYSTETDVNQLLAHQSWTNDTAVRARSCVTSSTWMTMCRAQSRRPQAAAIRFTTFADRLRWTRWMQLTSSTFKRPR